MEITFVANYIYYYQAVLKMNSYLLWPEASRFS